MGPLGRVGDRWGFGGSCGGGGVNGSAQQMEVRCGMLSIRCVELEERMGGRRSSNSSSSRTSSSLS